MKNNDSRGRIGMYFPFTVTLCYVLVTFAMSVIGPARFIKYEYNFWLVGLFLACVLFCMFAGYYFGLKARPKTSASYISIDKARSLVRIFLVIAFFSLLIELLYLYFDGHFGLNISSISENYFGKENGTSPVMIIGFITEFFCIAGISLGMYLYKDLNKKNRVLLFSVVLLVFIVSLFGYGQQKSFTDLFIYLFVAVFASRLRNGKKVSRKTKRIIVMLFTILFFLLSFVQYQRYSSIGVTPYNYASRSAGEVEYDTNHPFFRIFGDRLGFGMSVISTGYLSTGYYGLSLCLQLPFEWTYGIGGSRALMSLSEKVGLPSVYKKTYLYRMEKEFGRNGLASWNTIFPWLASDFSFFGVLLYFFVFGYICSVAWREVLRCNNVVSYLMVVLCFIMIFYIPANNQLFHSYSSFISTCIILFLWLFKRRKYNLKEA